jgi:hypothetical protein
MTANFLNFFLDIPNRRLIRDFFSNLEIIPRPMIQGDTVHLRIIGVEPNIGSDPTRPWRYVPLPTALYFGLGPVGVGPTLGTFTLTFGADTTSPLAFNISSAALTTALNALASITTAGGVDVTGPNSGPFQIVFRTNGAQSNISADADLLYPLSGIQTYDARAGDAGTPAIQVLVIDRQPAALAQTFTVIAAPGITITTLEAGGSGIPDVQKIALDATTHGGTFTLTFSAHSTVALPYNISAANLQAALESLSSIGPGNIVITGAFPEFVATFQGTLTGTQPAITASSAGLIGPVGVEGDLALSTAGIEQLLSGEASVSTFLEISAQISGAPVTLLQTTVTLLNDQIPNAPATGTTLPAYYTTSEIDAGYYTKTQIDADIYTKTQIDAAIYTKVQTDAAYAKKTGVTLAHLTADASTAVTLSATFDHTQSEAAINALGTKLNVVITKQNAILAQLEASLLLTA